MLPNDDLLLSDHKYLCNEIGYARKNSIGFIFNNILAFHPFGCSSVKLFFYEYARFVVKGTSIVC